MIGQSYYVFVIIFDFANLKGEFLPVCGHCPCNKSITLKRFHKSHYNPFQSSSSLFIRLSFCACCVIYTLFSSFEQLFCFTQFGGGFYCLNF